MPSCCAVINCGMRGNRNRVSFFRFPASLKNAGEKLNALSKERREEWVRALKKGSLSETQLKYGRICSRHFKNGAPAKLADKDNPDWIPNQQMGCFKPKTATQLQVDRRERSLKRKRIKQDKEIGRTKPSNA